LRATSALYRMRRRSASALNLYFTSLPPNKTAMRHFSALRRCRRLATFRSNNKKLRIMRQLLKLTKSFSDS
jgi:hypothetical protein